MVQDVLGRELHELTDAQRAELAESKRTIHERAQDLLNEAGARLVAGSSVTPDFVARVRELVEHIRATSA